MKETLITVLRKLKDPRKRHKKKKHLLIDIVILTILGVLCGADSWDAIELFGKKKYDFLKKILKLPNGIPAHDTINRVISMIDPKQFEKLFVAAFPTHQSVKPKHFHGIQLSHNIELIHIGNSRETYAPCPVVSGIPSLFDIQ